MEESKLSGLISKIVRELNLNDIVKKLDSMDKNFKDVQKQLDSMDKNFKDVQKQLDNMDKNFKDDIFVLQRQIAMLANNAYEDQDFIKSLNLAAAAGGDTRLVNPIYSRY